MQPKLYDLTTGLEVPDVDMSRRVGVWYIVAKREGIKNRLISHKMAIDPETSKPTEARYRFLALSETPISKRPKFGEKKAAPIACRLVNRYSGAVKQASIVEVSHDWKTCKVRWDTDDLLDFDLVAHIGLKVAKDWALVKPDETPEEAKERAGHPKSKQRATKTKAIPVDPRQAALFDLDTE
jgi:hypothetical protein